MIKFKEMETIEPKEIANKMCDAVKKAGQSFVEITTTMNKLGDVLTGQIKHDLWKLETNDASLSWGLIPQQEEPQIGEIIKKHYI